MSQDDAFLREIIEHPDEDAPRLAYANYLEKHGDADRAEFIRVQCERSRLWRDDPRWLDLAERERALLGRCAWKWLGARREQFLAQFPAFPQDREARDFALVQNALPLWFDMGGCYALRLDGELVSFAWDDPGPPRIEWCERIHNVVLFHGAKKYPELRLLLPPRPVTSRVCPTCGGTGTPANLPRIVCHCGGLGWLPPAEGQST
jgi:uncharacterized protein (TIGR02996 family)